MQLYVHIKAVSAMDDPKICLQMTRLLVFQTPKMQMFKLFYKQWTFTKNFLTELNRFSQKTFWINYHQQIFFPLKLKHYLGQKNVLELRFLILQIHHQTERKKAKCSENYNLSYLAFDWLKSFFFVCLFVCLFLFLIFSGVFFVVVFFA